LCASVDPEVHAPPGLARFTNARDDRCVTVVIPTSRYTSPEFAQAEAERLWPHVWQLACSADHVAEPGDYHEYTNGLLSVLIVRGDDGELRAFQNACRHRGSALCEGSGCGLTEIRCPFHRWTWDLAGRLREVPSRRAFGVQNDDLPLVPVQVATWGPLVFVNLDLDAAPLAEFLSPVPADCAWARIEEMQCVMSATAAARCNWKTLIEGFSETYHVQGIHREMLPMCDDVNGPQVIWDRHGKLEQSYGLPSPRLRNVPNDQQVWESFVQIMGIRVGNVAQRDAGPAPAVPDGGTMRSTIASIVRDRGIDGGHEWYASLTDAQLVDMAQYNLFPNLTVLVFSDMLQVVRSRPGATPDDAFMDAFVFTRDNAPGTREKPPEIFVGADEDFPFGLVLDQDKKNVARSQRGLHQPGMTHLTISATEECRIANLHRNLEHYLGLSPSTSTQWVPE
jgi:phenylpropionate dioxygenase-like ring-hydroxylating dioxygenase large terminal subunit